MPAGYESGLRVVEHYLGRANATKQPRGVFPSITSAPTITAGRNIRVRDGVLTGIAAIPESAVSVHGVRPTFSVQFDGIPEDLPPFLGAFFHNVQVTNPPTAPVPSPFRVTSTFKYGMLDSRPDHTGVVMGDYDPAAVAYSDLVAIADLYTIGLEWLYGRGDLGDTSNGISIDNCVVNRLAFECQRGADQVLQVTAEGFGRAANEIEDYAAASWGPGVNGTLSTQAVLSPEDFTFQLLEINTVDKAAVFTDWMDSISVEMTSGISGRDNLGSDVFGSILTDGRPQANCTLGFSHIDPSFLTAMVNNQAIEVTARFSDGAGQILDIKFPNLRVTEEFAPNSGDANTDIDVQVPMVAVVNPDAATKVPLVEVSLTTEYDARHFSYWGQNTISSLGDLTPGETQTGFATGRIST